MSDSARSQMYYVKEGTYGQTPASALKEFRFTGESLDFALETVTSNEIRGDRQITDVIPVGGQSNGGLNWELSYGCIDDFLEGALMSAWGSTLTLTGVTISASVVDNSFNYSANNAPAFVPGQWIKVSGFSNQANNGFFQVVSRTVAKVIVSGGTLATESAGPSVTTSSTAIRNGATKISYTLEKKFADVTQFMSFTGMCINNMNLNFAIKSIMTGDFTFIGKASALAGTTVGTGGPTAAPTADVMNSSTNLAQLFEGGSALNLANVTVKDLKISLNNNLRPIDGMGNISTQQVGMGRCNVTGSMSVYFQDATFYNKFKNSTVSSVAIRMSDGTNNYLFSLPRLKYLSSKIVAGAADSDVMAEMTFQALRHATYDHTIEICKW